MLQHRILTAIPLATLVVWVLLFESSQHVVYLLLLVSLLASLEWAHLAGVQALLWRAGYALLLTTLSWLVLQYIYEYVQWLVLAAVCWWFAMALNMRRAIPATPSARLAPQKLLAGVLVVPAAVIAMTVIHASNQGPQWLLYALMLVWVADIGAYFAGRRFGKHKLAPMLSPGKTREGLYGALVLTSMYTFIACLYFALDNASCVFLMLLSLAMTLISVSGDLYESLLKRERGVKDSGHLLPGHGGMLDRIDSVLAAMPLFLLGMHWLVHPMFNVSLFDLHMFDLPMFGLSP